MPEEERLTKSDVRKFISKIEDGFSLIGVSPAGEVSYEGKSIDLKPLLELDSNALQEGKNRRTVEKALQLIKGAVEASKERIMKTNITRKKAAKIAKRALSLLRAESELEDALRGAEGREVKVDAEEERERRKRDAKRWYDYTKRLK